MGDQVLKVFLGGTVNGSTWREEVISKLNIDYFDPVVKEWNEEARQNELRERETCDYNLYVLSPKMVGFYSIAEVVDDSFKKPGQTLFCFLSVDGPEKFTANQLTSLRYLGRVVEQNGGIWCKSIDEVTTFFNKLQCKAEYYHIYQKLLRKAVNWNRNNRDSSFFLKGFPLIDARRWLGEAKKSDLLAPTQLIHDFYQASADDELSSHHITTFISYARTPSLEFASELFTELEANGVNSWFDKQNIRAGVDFREEIRMGVERAGNFIYIITNSSINSPYCQMELELAKSSGKRIIPIQQGQVDETKIDPDIQSIHRLFYKQNTKEALDKVVRELVKNLKEGQDFIHYHTKFLRRAVQWQKEQKHKSYLLKGNELAEGYSWLTSTINNLTPSQPIPLHGEYLTQSRQASENGMVDYWICSHKETGFERQLVEHLTGKGITVGCSWQHDDNTQEIIKATKFIWVISSGAVNSEKCLSEVEFAKKQHFAIVPVLIEKIDVGGVLSEEEKSGLVDLTSSVAEGGAWLRQLSDLSETVLGKELEDHKELRFLRYRYYKWKNSKEDDAFLLRHHCLANYGDWLTKKQAIAGHFYTELKRYLEACEARNPELVTAVFIAHHEERSHFAFLINEKLGEYQKVCWSDQSFVENKDQSVVCLDQLESAENFVGIVSENFFRKATSYQVRKAIEVGKRVVFIREDPEVVIPEAFASATVIDFSEDFDLAMIQLVRYLDTDFQYVKRHSQLLREALAWDRSGKGSNKLLRSADELASARQWMEGAAGKTPAITPLQQAYIEESLAEQRKSKRLKKAVVYAIVTLSVFSLFFGVWAYQKTLEANDQKAQAEKNKQEAEDNYLIAKANADSARMNALMAKANADSARARTLEARSAAAEARRQSKIVRQRELEAIASKHEADSLSVLAEKKAKEADEHRIRANKNRDEAHMLAAIEVSKRKALLAEKLLLSNPKASLDSLMAAYEALNHYPEHQRSDIFFQAFSRVFSALQKGTLVLRGKRALVKSTFYENKIYALSENGVFHVAELTGSSRVARISSESLVNALTFTIGGDLAFFGNRFGEINSYRIAEATDGQPSLKLLNNDQVHARNTAIVGIRYLDVNRSGILSVGYDGSVIISSSNKLGLKRQFKNEPRIKRVKALDVSPNQHYLAMAGSDRVLEYYDIGGLVATNGENTKLTASGQLQLSEVPTTMKFLSESTLIIGYQSGQVDLWNLQTRKRTKIESQQEHKKAITSLDVQKGVLVSGSRDAQVTIRTWDDQKVDGLPDRIYKYSGHSSPNEIREVIFVGSNEVVSMDNKNLFKWKISIDELYQSLKQYKDEEGIYNIATADRP